MIKITINWKAERINIKQLNEKVASHKKERGFYAIYCKGEVDTLLYIGQTYQQKLDVRMQQDHSSYNCINKFKENKECDLKYLLGIIVSKSVNNETSALYDDIENCLINKNKPLCNTNDIIFYNGEDMEIVNTGEYYPLYETSNCEFFYK